MSDVRQIATITGKQRSGNMTNEQAIAILKQPDRIGCNLIKATDEESCKYNQESIEAFNMAVSSLDRLEKIEQIIDDCDSGMISCEQLFLNLRTILEQE
jgi:hypothetical protein